MWPFLEEFVKVQKAIATLRYATTSPLFVTQHESHTVESRVSKRSGWKLALRPAEDGRIRQQVFHEPEGSPHTPSRAALALLDWSGPAGWRTANARPASRRLEGFRCVLPRGAFPRVGGAQSGFQIFASQWLTTSLANGAGAGIVATGEMRIAHRNVLAG